MPNAPKFWTGTVPALDDFGKPIANIFIDGRTRMGPWAFMSPISHLIYGIGLGTGYGQKYVKTHNGRWLKVEG